MNKKSNIQYYYCVFRWLNAFIATSSKKDPSIYSGQKCSTFNGMIAEQYSSIYRMQKAPLPTEIMSEQDWNIYSMQKSPTFNKNNCQGGFRHLGWAEMPQCQWKTEASTVCRNAPLWTEIISEWDSSIYIACKNVPHWMERISEQDPSIESG